MSNIDQGYKDFRNGQISNPYPPNTQKHREWQFGFNKAYFNNLERVKSNEARRGSKTVQST